MVSDLCLGDGDLDLDDAEEELEEEEDELELELLEDILFCDACGRIANVMHIKNTRIDIRIGRTIWYACFTHFASIMHRARFDAMNFRISTITKQHLNSINVLGAHCKRAANIEMPPLDLSNS